MTLFYGLLIEGSPFQNGTLRSFIKPPSWAKTVNTRKRIANSQVGTFSRGRTLVTRKLEIVFMNKDGKFYPLDEVNSAELAEGLEKISRETAKRLLLQKEQR